MSNKQPFTIYIEKEILDLVRQEAEENELSVNTLLTYIISLYLVETN